MCLLFWLMYVDFSSLFVKFELYKVSFDKYLLEFTIQEIFCKTNIWKIVFASCMYKKFDLPDVWKKMVFYRHEKRILSSMKILASETVVTLKSTLTSTFTTYDL